MLSKIAIKKTGNFWLDAGLVGLANSLKEVVRDHHLDEDDESTIAKSELDANSFSLMAESPGINLLKILKSTKANNQNYLLRKTGNKGWILNHNEEFEVYEKTDFFMHLKPFFAGKTPIHEGKVVHVPEGKSYKGNALILNDEQSKAFLKFKNANEDCRLKDEGFIHECPKYSLGSEVTEDIFSEGKNFCQFGKASFKKVEEVTGIHFPFLSSYGRGEINFAPNLSKKPKISSLYAFVSEFSFRQLYFQSQADRVHYFLVHDPSLKEMRDFNYELTGSFTKRADNLWQNFKSVIPGCTYSSENILVFLLSMYSQIKNELKRDRLFTKKIYTFSTDKKLFSNVTVFSKMYRLFDFFRYAGDQALNEFFKSLIEKKGDKYETIHRDKVANKILNFLPINHEIELFLSEVRLTDGIPLKNCQNIVSNYNEFINLMDENSIELCKKVGLMIGGYVAESGDKRILYAIRNARNRIDFLKVLSEGQFRMADYYEIKLKQRDDNLEEEKVYAPVIGHDFIVKIPGDRTWSEFKSLVSIFAMNFYMIRNKSNPHKPSKS